MPPTAASFSSTVTGSPAADSRHAADMPGRPGAEDDDMRLRQLRSGLLGDDEVVEVHGERQRAETAA